MDMEELEVVAVVKVTATLPSFHTLLLSHLGNTNDVTVIATVTSSPYVSGSTKGSD